MRRGAWHACMADPDPDPDPDTLTLILTLPLTLSITLTLTYLRGQVLAQRLQRLAGAGKLHHCIHQRRQRLPMAAAVGAVAGLHSAAHDGRHWARQTYSELWPPEMW